MVKKNENLFRNFPALRFLSANILVGGIFAGTLSASATAADLGVQMYSKRMSANIEKSALRESIFGTKPSKGLSGDFSMRSNQFVENVGEVTGNQYWGDLNLKYLDGGSGDRVKNISVATRMNNESQLMYSVPEAYIKFDGRDSSLKVGRSVLEWGFIDSVWSFGKLNNRINFDFFEPGREGLTGVLFDKQADGVRLSLFGSLLYVPELNPSQVYDEKNGTITCKNPWCEPMERTVPFQGKQIPVFYNIDYPDVDEVVFRYSAGARIAMELGKSGEIEVFGIRKPENQLSVAAEYYYENATKTAYVDATPQVYYHDVLGANLKLKVTDRIMGYVGALSSTPNTYPDGFDLQIVYTGIKPMKKKEEYVGGGAFYIDERFKAGAHYIARVSDFDLVNDLMVQYPRWNQALNLNISSNLTRKISVAFDYKWDMLTEDRLTMFSASYMVSPGMLASAGVNMIGTSGDVESYWSKYTNNDSVYGSLKVQF